MMGKGTVAPKRGEISTIRFMPSLNDIQTYGSKGQASIQMSATQAPPRFTEDTIMASIANSLRPLPVTTEHLVITMTTMPQIDGSTITTTDFSATIIVSKRGDEPLVPGYHNVLQVTPNVKLSILSHRGHVTHFAFCIITVDIRFLHLAVAWIYSLSDTTARV